MIGGDARTDWLGDAVKRDERGYILTGNDLAGPAFRSGAGARVDPPSHLETSVPGVFAVGDVRHGSVKRAVSAAGEGAMVMSLVHQYLGQRQ
jgi:thioredoxin reductase (NADPH)